MTTPVDLPAEQIEELSDGSSFGQFVRETLIYGTSVVLSRALALLMLPLYVNALEPDEFGTASLVTAATLATTIASGLGLHHAIPRWYWLVTDGAPADRKSTIATAVWCQLLVALSLAVGVLIFAEPVAAAVTGDAGDGRFFRLVALGFPLTVLDSGLRTWLRLRRRAGTTVVVTTGTALIALGTAAVLVGWLQLGLWGVFGAAFAAQLAGGAMAIVLMRSWLSPRGYDGVRARAMLSFSWPWIPGDVAYWILDLSDRFIIRHYWSETEVAKYQMASTLAAATSLAVQAVQQAWLPFALSMKKRSDSGRIYARSLTVYLATVGTVAVVTAALMRHAISIVAPSVYLSATTAGGLLAAAYMVRGARTLAVTGTVIGGSQVGAVGALFIAAGTNVGLNLLIVPSAGITGAAGTTVIAYVVALGLTFLVAHRLYAIPYSYGTACALIFAVTTIAWIRSATSTAFGLTDSLLAVGSVVAFGVTLVATRALSPRDVEHWCRHRLGRLRG